MKKYLWILLSFFHKKIQEPKENSFHPFRAKFLYQEGDKILPPKEKNLAVIVNRLRDIDNKLRSLSDMKKYSGTARIFVSLIPIFICVLGYGFLYDTEAIRAGLKFSLYGCLIILTIFFIGKTIATISQVDTENNHASRY